MIKLNDARTLLRILSQLKCSDSGFESTARFLLNALASMISTPAAFAVELTGMRAGRSPEVTGYQAVFNDVSGATERSAELHRDPLEEPLFSILLMRLQPDRVFTTTASCLDESSWHNGSPLGGVRRRTKALDFIWSLRPGLVSGHYHALGFYRFADQLPSGLPTPKFTERETDLVHLLHEELGWFYAEATNDVTEPTRALSPREHDVLALLLAGDSEKQVASKLEISQHTVHEYVKLLYRHFNVSSRPELMAQFIDPLRRRAASPQNRPADLVE